MTIRPSLIDGGTAQLLAQWQLMVDEGRIDEASDILATLANNHGDELVSVADPSTGLTMLVPLQRHLWDLLTAARPDSRPRAELLDRFSRRYDEALRTRLQTAIAAVDLPTLRELALKHQLSKVSSAAQLTLGDLTWGEGNLDAAEHWWRMAELSTTERAGLAQAASATSDTSPNDVDLAVRLMMLDIARHDLNAAHTKLTRLQARAADAELMLWGRPQRWRSVLAPLLTPASPSTTPNAPNAPNASNTSNTSATQGLSDSARPGVPGSGQGEGAGSSWTGSKLAATDSFGPTITGIDDWRPGRLRVLWSVSWQALSTGSDPETNLESRSESAPSQPSTEHSSLSADESDVERWRGTDRPVARQPLPWRNRLLVTDSAGFTSFDLATGRRQFDVHPLASPADSSAGGVQSDQAAELAPAVIAGDRLAMVVEPTDSEGRRARSMVMVCELSSEGRLVCVGEPPSGDLEFGSGPVLDRQSMWLVTRPRSGAGSWGIARYESDSGRLVWHSMLPPAAAINARLAADPALARLSMAGNWLIVTTHHGQIAAVDAMDGTMRWMLSDVAGTALNRRSPGRDWLRSRPLAAPYHADGLLVCALPERVNLLALDEITGRLRWETQIPASELDVLELAGRVDDTLIATGHRVWQLELTTGQPVRRGLDNPFPAESTAIVAGGPGLVCGDYLLWTARHRDASNWFYAWHLPRATWAVPPYPLQLPGIGLSQLQRHDRFWLAINAQGLTVLSAH